MEGRCLVGLGLLVRSSERAREKVGEGDRKMEGLRREIRKWLGIGEGRPFVESEYLRPGTFFKNVVSRWLEVSCDS